jgi:O-Antigen ligase
VQILRSSRGTGAGWPTVVVVALTVLTHALLPPSWLQIALSAVAFALVAMDRRYGVLGAATLLLLALPYDRAASNDLVRIASIPIRPHDLIVAIGVVASLPGILRLRPSGTAVVLGGFLALGVVAFVLGVLLGNAPRDILRDARWWFLYAAGLLALGLPAARPRILRGLLVGATIFAAVAVLVVLLPAFEDGLKYRALIYDKPVLRMQFGNSVFLIPATLYVAWRWFKRPAAWTTGWLLLLSAGVALSVTRVLMLLTLGCLVVGVIWWARRSPDGLRRGPAIIGMALAGMVLGLGVNLLHPVAGALVGVEPPVEGGGLFDRLTFQGSTGAEAIGSGRFETYVEAMNRIRTSPVLGLGMGSLIDVDYEFGGVETATPGKSPLVDNAYLTVGLKAGAVGIAALAVLLLWPLSAWRRRAWDPVVLWLLPAWLGVLGLTMTQSFAVNGYSPFSLSLLIAVLGGLGYASTRRSRAADHMKRS